nr:hypothetical protein [Tanacetum cinerariifolium]GEX87415.1 hypothetical protein [Tanacetum cinerariifolium]
MLRNSRCELFDQSESRATSPTRSSIRKIIGSGLRMPSPNIGFFDKSLVRGNTESYSKVPQVHKQISTNIKRKSLKEDSGSFKGKVLTDMKTKKVQSDQCLLTQSQKKDMCSFEDQVNGLSSHLESISLNRDAEVRSQPSYSNRRQLSTGTVLSSQMKYAPVDFQPASRSANITGLRISSPRIGFFDELNSKGSMQRLNEFPSVKGRASFLHKAYGIVPSTLVQVC